MEPEQGKENTGQTPKSLWKSKLGKSRFHLKKDQLLIGLLTGILLLVIAWPTASVDENTENGSGWNEETAEQETGSRNNQNSGGSTAADAYTRELENRLAEALGQVEGVGRVKVLITWKNSAEKVVEKDVPGSSQNVAETDGSGGTRTTVTEEFEENTVYTEGENGSRTPYVVKEVNPTAEGVLIVAEGGGNSLVARQILEAVQALFPLDAHKIKIMKMEGSK